MPCIRFRCKVTVFVVIEMVGIRDPLAYVSVVDIIEAIPVRSCCRSEGVRCASLASICRYSRLMTRTASAGITGSATIGLPVCPIRIKKPPSWTLQSRNLSCAGPWPVNFTAVSLRSSSASSWYISAGDSWKTSLLCQSYVVRPSDVRPRAPSNCTVARFDLRVRASLIVNAEVWPKILKL